MPKSSMPALLLMIGQVPRAARVQRRDEVLGNAAEAEAAHHDGGAVGDARHRFVGARRTLFIERWLYRGRCSPI